MLPAMPFPRTFLPACLMACLGAFLALVPVLAQTFDYDDAGRLVRVRFADGRAVDYAHDDAGNLLSVAPAAIPPAPAGLAVGAGDGFSQALTWEDRADNETGYRVERRVAGRYDWVPLATLDPDSTAYIDALGGYDQRFLYRVVATGVDGNDSAYSPEIEMTRAAESYFPGTSEVEGGWRESETFGVIYTALFPWIHSPDHGWWFVEGSGDPSIFLYDLKLGWLWTREDLYPYLYSFQRRAFLFYDSTEGPTRFFYDFEQKAWLEVNLSR